MTLYGPEGKIWSATFSAQYKANIRTSGGYKAENWEHDLMLNNPLKQPNKSPYFAFKEQICNSREVAIRE